MQVDGRFRSRKGGVCHAGERRCCSLRGDTEPIHLTKQLLVSEYWANPSRISLRECTVRIPASYR
jgi:hypothetical protein